MMEIKKVTARIPASTTNLGPGFDVLGLAVKLYSIIEGGLLTANVFCDKILSNAEILNVATEMKDIRIMLPLHF